MPRACATLLKAGAPAVSLREDSLRAPDCPGGDSPHWSPRQFADCLFVQRMRTEADRQALLLGLGLGC